MYKFLFVTVFLSLCLHAEDPIVSSPPLVEAVVETPEKTTAAPLTTDVSKISEAFGHLIGKNLDSVGFKLDIAQVIKGLQDASSGKEAPMTETECVQAITAIQEAAFKQQATENLKKANEFLAQNMKQNGIISLEPGKLQYRVEKTGGGAVVEDHFSPLIRYKGKFIDGTVFGSSKEDELISLDEAMPGFTKGIIGMKEGEVRTLFIHPDLGYGTSGYLPPNSLLTFEIEVIKAHAPQPEPVDTLSKEKINPEIALPGDEIKAVR